MKIICLIRPEPAANYFVNAIHQTYGVELVIRELPKPNDLFQRMAARLGRGDLIGLAEALRYRCYHWRQRGLHQRAHQQYFGNAWQACLDEIPQIDSYDIHRPEIIQRLRSEQADLLLVHGTSILKEELLSTAKLALNLHWGLSPYYRGVRCTEWALLNWDPYNIGVSIHELSARIDGGRILAQSRANILETATIYGINMQLTYLGTELLKKAISKIKSGKQLVFHPQALNQGQLIQNRHWSRHISRQIQHIEQHGLIKEMLKRPSRKEKFPIVLTKTK